MILSAILITTVFTFSQTAHAVPSGTRMSALEARQTVIERFGGIIQKIEYTYDEEDPLYKGEALKKDARVVFELNARTGDF